VSSYLCFFSYFEFKFLVQQLIAWKDLSCYMLSGTFLHSTKKLVQLQLANYIAGSNEMIYFAVQQCIA